MKKTFYGLGTIIAAASPVIAVVSCTQMAQQDKRSRLEEFIDINLDGQRNENLCEIIAVHAEIWKAGLVAGVQKASVLAEDRYGDIIGAYVPLRSGNIDGVDSLWGTAWQNIRMIKPAKDVLKADYDWDIDELDEIPKAPALSLTPEEIWFDAFGNWDKQAVLKKSEIVI